MRTRETLSPRFIEIDSLRFIACALVIIQHGLSYLPQSATQGSPLERIILILSPGWLGVLIFFSISGFVIPSSLKGPRLGSLKTFIKRRFFRLYPPFWTAALIIILLDPKKYAITDLLWRVSMLPVQDRNVFGHSSYFWTLHIELVFYFLVSLLFLLFGRFTYRFFISILIIIAIPYTVWVATVGGRFAPFFDFSQCLPFSMLLMFWGGCCRAVLQEDSLSENPRKKYSRAVKIGLASGILTMLPLHAIYFGVSEWSLWQLHEGSSTILGIFIFLFWAILKPIKPAFLALLGRNTYSTYLLHGAVNLTLPYFLMKVGIMDWPLPSLLILVLVCSFAIGELFYRFVEIPSNSLGRNIK
ncbi:acyltransferase family protein [Cephaloticoccus capnophilus]|uniref:acyltransferase family protein n=1 Tax=Cephaloticoccus capnophilus TaxID=1548208 RepID=UPI0018D40F5F